MHESKLPELAELGRILEKHHAHLEARTLCEVADQHRRLPVQAVVLGSESRDTPAVGFFGGVHGLERVGTQVLLSFLDWLAGRMEWDERVQRLVSGLRVVFLPLVNPAGMSAGKRANGNGVDLMRNAPVESRERVTFLLGGQRISARLPWYRGARGAPMEPESEALCALVREELLSRPFSLALDCHSGFGLRDRVWFPYAHTSEPFAQLAEVHALVARYTQAHPSHPYLFEPQSRRYLAHGDLWDHLCAQAPERGNVFLPLTLEMGSWRWIRKSPRQIWSRIGLFNPMPPDRLQRVRRNHLPLLHFLCQAARTHREWVPVGPERQRHEQGGLAAWFGKTA
jgi:predicted deacylase